MSSLRRRARERSEGLKDGGIIKIISDVDNMQSMQSN